MLETLIPGHGDSAEKVIAIASGALLLVGAIIWVRVDMAINKEKGRQGQASGGRSGPEIPRYKQPEAWVGFVSAFLGVLGWYLLAKS